jgi:hypothetical protein
MLKMTIHDAAGQRRLELEGRLAGVWVSELERCWRTAKASHPNQTLAVDLISVTFTDQAGRYLLQSREESRMKCLSTLRIGPALVLGFFLSLEACTRAPSEAPAPEPTSVMVSYPVERDVTDYADFTARTDAVDSVGVRARVWG